MPEDAPYAGPPITSLKSLPHEDALMALSALRFIEGELGGPIRGQKLLIAFSGGADSTALLTMFCALRQSQALELAAAHLDHGLREESAQDARSAEALCQALGVPFMSRRCHVAA
ncbi:MAG: tRNA lysidine(34) synthetase TilS, partial [Mailhella sp.]|nr:tRNA lysidine(34) synthetase TilS [Mailhella sp.]